MGWFIMSRGKPNKRYTPEFKKLVVETMMKEGEEDLLAEVLRLRAENEYLKNLQALVLEDERRQHKKRW